jgi:hypothetical protein
MIRWVLRTLAILLGASLIAGGIYLFSQSSAANSFSAGPERRFERGLSQGGPSSGSQDNPGFSRGGRDFNGGPGGREQASVGRGLGEVLQSLIQVALVVLAVLGIQRLWGSRRNRLSGSSSP